MPVQVPSAADVVRNGTQRLYGVEACRKTWKTINKDDRYRELRDVLKQLLPKPEQPILHGWEFIQTICQVPQNGETLKQIHYPFWVTLNTYATKAEHSGFQRK